MKSFLMFLEEVKGTYVAVRFHGRTVTDLSIFLRDNNIQNSLTAEKFHSTVIFSRKYISNFNALGFLSVPLIGSFKGYDVWEGADGKNALVMLYDCPRLVQRHRDIMDNYDATYDFDDYIPHITLSYDVGENFDINKLPKFNGSIIINEEYSEDLNLEWNKS